MLYLREAPCATQSDFFCADLRKSDGESLQVELDLNETIYIVVGGYGTTANPQESGSFTLTVSVPDEGEPNDTLATAARLDRYETGTGREGSISPASDVDWFSFEVGDFDMPSIFVHTEAPSSCGTGDGANVIASIHDSSGAVLETSDDDLGLCPLFFFLPPAGGTYYIQVKASPGQTTPTEIPWYKVVLVN